LLCFALLCAFETRDMQIFKVILVFLHKPNAHKSE
jgi:hypothetical protein